jgi:hypothetical protein
MRHSRIVGALIASTLACGGSSTTPSNGVRIKRVVAPRNSSIAGVVVDDESRAGVGAEVRVASMPIDTSEDGRFELPMPPDRYLLEVRAQGYLRAFRDVASGDPEERPFPIAKRAAPRQVGPEGGRLTFREAIVDVPPGAFGAPADVSLTYLSPARAAAVARKPQFLDGGIARRAIGVVDLELKVSPQKPLNVLVPVPPDSTVETVRAFISEDGGESFSTNLAPQMIESGTALFALVNSTQLTITVDVGKAGAGPLGYLVVQDDQQRREGAVVPDGTLEAVGEFAMVDPYGARVLLSAGSSARIGSQSRGAPMADVAEGPAQAGTVALSRGRAVVVTMPSSPSPAGFRLSAPAASYSTTDGAFTLSTCRHATGDLDQLQVLDGVVSAKGDRTSATDVAQGEGATVCTHCSDAPRCLPLSGPQPDAALPDDGSPSYDSGNHPASICSSGETESTLVCEVSVCALEHRACCVTSGTCCAPAAIPVGQRLDFQNCGPDPASCVMDGAPFGQAKVVPALGRLLPGGSAVLDGGLVFGPKLDTASELTLQATLAVPVGAGCRSDCLEVVGLGFGGQSPDEAGARISPVVALVLSAARARMVLISGTTILWEKPVDAEAHSYQLTLKPNGAVSLTVDGKLEAGTSSTVSLPASHEVRALVYGRNGSSLPDDRRAYADDLTVAARACADPSRWQSVQEVWAGRQPAGWSSASLASSPGEAGIAIETSGGVYFSHHKDLETLLTQPTEGSLALVPAAVPFAVGTIESPELAWADGRWVVYFAARDKGGRRSIGRAWFDGARFGDVEKVIDGESVSMDLDGPSVITAEGRTLLVVRGLSGGVGSLLLFDDSPVPTGADASAADGGDAGQPDDAPPPRRFRLVRVIAARGRDAKDFDTMGLDSGDLVLAEHTFQLYYGGHGSAVTAVGVQASDDLAHWTRKRLVLAPRTDGFEALGVTNPDVLVQAKKMFVVFTTGDGRTGQLGWTSRPVVDF